MENLSSTLMKKQENFALPSLVRFSHLRQLGLTGRVGYKKNASLRYAEARAAMPASNVSCEVSTATKSTFVITFSYDGRLVASSHGDHSVRVSELKTGKCLHTLVGHPRTPWTLTFHPSSADILASGCIDGDVRIWDLKGGGSEVWKAPARTVIASLTFHPTDQVLVIATANVIHFWDWAHEEPFACAETSNDYEKVRWVKFDCWGHYLYTGIANGSTIQREDPLDAASFSENFWSGETVGDVLRERHRLRQQYRNILSRFGHNAQSNAPPPTAPYSRPSTSGDLDLDPVLNPDLSDILHPSDIPRTPSLLNPPELSPSNRGALDEARLYASRVTRESQRPRLNTLSHLGRTMLRGTGERIQWNSTLQPSSRRRTFNLDSDEEDDDTDEDLSRLSSTSRGNRNERTPLEQDFRNFRVRSSLAEDQEDENSNSTSIGGPGSSFVPYTQSEPAESVTGLSRPRLSFTELGSLLDTRRTRSRINDVAATSSTTTIPTTSVNNSTNGAGNEVDSTATSQSIVNSSEVNREQDSNADRHAEVAGSSLGWMRDFAPDNLSSYWGRTQNCDNAESGVSSSRTAAESSGSDRPGSSNRSQSSTDPLPSASSVLSGIVTGLGQNTVPNSSADVRPRDSGPYVCRHGRIRTRLADYRSRHREPLTPFAPHAVQPYERSYEERLAASRRLRESLARIRRHESGLRRQNAFRLRRGMLTDENRHHECSATNLRDCQCPSQFLARRRRQESDSGTNEDRSQQEDDSRKRPRSESPNTRTRQSGSREGQEPARKMRRTDSYCDNPASSSSDQTASAAAANAPSSEQSPGTASARSPAEPNRASAHGNISAAASRYLRDPQNSDPFLPSTTRPELDDNSSSNYERPYNTLLHSLRRRILDLHDQLQRHQRSEPPERESNAASSSGVIDLTAAAPFTDSPSAALRTLMSEQESLERRSLEEEARILEPRLLQRRNAVIGERRSFFLEENVEPGPQISPRLDGARSELQQLMNEPLSAIRQRPGEMSSRSMWRQRNRPHIIPEITITRPAESPSSMLENAEPDIHHFPADSEEETVQEAAGDERSTLVRNLNLARFEAMRVRFLQREREREREQWQRDERERQRDRERENQAFERRWSRTWRQLQRRHLHPHYSLDEGFTRNPHPHSFYRHVPGAFAGHNDPSLASSIVPLTHRIQRWDVRRGYPAFVLPDISQSDHNVIVPHCKIHNDSSVELSQDGLLVAAFVPNQGSFPDDSMLCVYSLHKDNLGQCLFSRTFGGPIAVSVSISPRSERILVGLAAKRTAWVWPPNHLVAQVFSLRSKEASGDLTMSHVYDVVHPCASDLRTQHVSVNSAKWLPGEGRGLIYGTNRGHLIMKTPGVEGKKVSKRGDPDDDDDTRQGLPVYAPTPLRRNIMEMLGLAPRTTSTSTQTSDEAQPAPSWRLRAITVDNQQPRAGTSSGQSTDESNA